MTLKLVITPRLLACARDGDNDEIGSCQYMAYVL